MGASWEGVDAVEGKAEADRGSPGTAEEVFFVVAPVANVFAVVDYGLHVGAETVASEVLETAELLGLVGRALFASAGGHVVEGDNVGGGVFTLNDHAAPSFGIALCES